MLTILFIYRFTPEEIQRLVPLLRIEEISFTNRYNPDPETALCIVCARLSYPSRWTALADLFGRSPSWLSSIFLDVMLHLHRRFKAILEWHPSLTYERLQEYATAIERVGGVEGVWGFVDGTFKGHQRPSGGREQRVVYSGHKRKHGINFQAIVGACGLVLSLFGPFTGTVNDWTMWRRSFIEHRLRRVMAGHNTLYIYGDPAYRSCFGVACPFTDPRGRVFLSPKEKAFNKALSSIRVSVEQVFGQTQELWTYNAFEKALTAGRQPIGTFFPVAVLLTNCHTCLRGTSSAGNRFPVNPLSIEEYLTI
jgi:nuclease HARBI1